MCICIYYILHIYYKLLSNMKAHANKNDFTTLNADISVLCKIEIYCLTVYL